MSHFANFDLIILFFILGAIASWIRSDLEISESISKFLDLAPIWWTPFYAAVSDLSSYCSGVI